MLARTKTMVASLLNDKKREVNLLREVWAQSDLFVAGIYVVSDSVRKIVSLVCLLLLFGTASFFLFFDTTGAEGLPDGTYLGSAQGYKSTIELRVLVMNGRVVEVTVVSHDETPFIADPAFAVLLPAIMELQGVDGVDAVSGATKTSVAVFEAFLEALATISPEL